MSGILEAATPNHICHSLHQLLGGIPACRFPYEESQIPKNGIYVLFEDGEVAHGTSGSFASARTQGTTSFAQG